MDEQGKQLLIVDDDPGTRELLTRYLNEQGYSVEAVADGVAMDGYLATQSADLIILDLTLPGEDGLAIARRLRMNGNIPIIILSARGEEVDRIIGLEVGADDYLPKPFNPRELLPTSALCCDAANQQITQRPILGIEKLTSSDRFISTSAHARLAHWRSW